LIPPARPEPTFLSHGRVRLALHTLRPGEGRPLLVLHGLGESTPAGPPRWLDAWPGPIFGLDLTGHGQSDVPAGGGYTAEILMADVDHALAHLGEATVVGRGLGAYVALLIAGARPQLVAGAILCDGPGLDGGGPAPHSPALVPIRVSHPAHAPDPFALIELTEDIRPADYASSFARQALQFSSLDAPISIAAVVRPPWLAAVAAEHGVIVSTVAAALNRYATATRAD